MAAWTKKAAIQRLAENTVAQEAMKLSPVVESAIEQAKQQRNVKGYNRIDEHVRLRNMISREVGSWGWMSWFQTSTAYDAVMGAIDDLLPPDAVDLVKGG